MVKELREYELDTAELIKLWNPRVQKFKDWYSLLMQEDTARVSGLESFVANEPRTIYNLALFLLTPQVIGHQIPLNEAVTTIQDAISTVEKLVQTNWMKLEEQAYQRGQQGWLYHLVSLLLATGWYSVFTATDPATGELIADIWNPAEVFPEYDDDGLTRVAHVYKQSASGARKKVAQAGWNITIPSNVPVEVIDYWEYGQSGQVENTVIINKQFAKHAIPYPDMQHLPVYVSPVNGLPDRGIIQTNQFNWRAHMGEGILATNEGVFKNYNRQMTFMQQILRDTAQPRITVRSKTKGVVNAANWAARGAIYELDVDESIETVPMPGIPPELTTLIQIGQSMMQRGGFAYSLYSGGEASGYAQSLVSASAQQVLEPFKKAISHLLTDIDNCWLDGLLAAHAQPVSLPPTARFKVDLKISIPGDLIQRATTARQLDPDFELSSTTVMDLLFPEIADPNRELVLSRRDSAMRRPEMAELDLIEALTESADALKAEGSVRQAQSYMALAQLIQAQLAGNQQQPTNQPPRPGPTGQANVSPNGQ